MAYSSTDLENTTTTNNLSCLGRIIIKSPRPKWQRPYYLRKKHRQWDAFTASMRSDTRSEPVERPILPMHKSFWMWQDRYLITEIRTYNDTRQTVSIYEDGELLTDGSFYGNDY